jgi:hypothetical protein
MYASGTKRQPHFDWPLQIAYLVCHMDQFTSEVVAKAQIEAFTRHMAGMHDAMLRRSDLSRRMVRFRLLQGPAFVRRLAELARPLTAATSRPLTLRSRQWRSCRGCWTCRWTCLLLWHTP